VVEAMLATQEEFGAVGPEAGALLGGPVLDPGARNLVEVKRFRKQAIRGARDTRFYGELFDELGLDPSRLTREQIASIPLTPKDALRHDPDAFVRRGAKPRLRAMTTGTTGWPTSVHFSDDEMRAIVAITSSHILLRQLVEPDDIVQVCISSRATLALHSVLGTCARIGAPAHIAGLVDPVHALSLLAEPRSIPGKRDKASVMNIYPSYLGELVECGRREGYGPSDFGLRRLVVGGEIVTEGLRERCTELFGDVDVVENYAMTEMVPMGGNLCSEGHLHFEVSGGLFEVQDLAAPHPAAYGAPGSIVATPFPPYRETTILLRYDTEDIVRPVAGPLDCEMRNMPATTNILGKRRLSVRHDEGWVFQRQVAEALERLPEVPLPARYGFWSAGGGVVVEARVRVDDARTRQAVIDSLAAHNVPVSELRLVTDGRKLVQPIPLRCDLREQAFARRHPSSSTTSTPTRVELTALAA